MTELGLGTAQFGMAYGVSNSVGCISAAHVAVILDRASAAGVRVLDTAAEYGRSEAVLGEVLPAGHGFRIVTKTPHFPIGLDARAIAARAVQGLETSLERLKQTSIYGLLVHDAKALAGENGEALWNTLEHLRRQGLIRKVGVSAYTGDEIDLIFARFTPDLVQVPLSVLDQRLLESGHLARLKAQGVEIHVRSVFLQGLLLMPASERHVYFRQFDRELAVYEAFLAQKELSALRCALAFIHSVPEVDAALIGVTSPEELQECVDALRSTPHQMDFAGLACRKPGLLNPSLWDLN